MNNEVLIKIIKKKGDCKGITCIEDGCPLFNYCSESFTFHTRDEVVERAKETYINNVGLDKLVEALL